MVSSAVRLPGRWTSNVSRKPASKYGLIEFLEQALTHFFRITKLLQIRQKVRPFDASSRHFRVQTLWLAVLGDLNGLARLKAIADFTKALLELSGGDFLHVEQIVR
jgi:hypothetical protein